MLAKKFRLSKNEVEYIAKKGQSITSGLFIARLVENEEEFCRYCVIISKKIHNKAFRRNRLRRQIYEALREAEKEVKISGLSLSLIPKKQILDKEFSDIVSDLKQLLTKLKAKQ